MTTIWIIHSDNEIANIIDVFLSNLGFYTDKKNDDFKTLDFKDCDILIIDFNAFDSEILDKLAHRFDNNNQDTKIILLSEYFTYDIPNLILDLQIDGFIIKSVDLNKLQKEVYSVLYKNNIRLNNVFSIEKNVNAIKINIKANIFILDELLIEMDIQYFSILNLINFIENNSYIKIVEILEDFIEILHRITSNTVDLIIQRIDEILLSLTLFLVQNHEINERIFFLRLFYQSYTDFMNLELYHSLQKSLFMIVYYNKVKNHSMIIKTNGLIITSYSLIGMYDKAIQFFNEFISLEFSNRQIQVLHKKYILLLLKQYQKTKVLIDDFENPQNSILLNMDLDDLFLENKFFIDQAYLNTLLISNTYFQNVESEKVQVQNFYSDLINKGINYNNISVIDNLINYYIITGDINKAKECLNSSIDIFISYNKAFYLARIDAIRSYLFIEAGNIENAKMLFLSYKEILESPFKNSVIYLEFFISYLNFLLIKDRYDEFESLFKDLHSDFMNYGLKGPYNFFLFKPLIHYSIIKNNFIFNLLSFEPKNEKFFEEFSFSSLAYNYLIVIMKINEVGLNKINLEKSTSLFYECIENKQIYLAKSIIVFTLELIINKFFEKNELGVYFIQIASEYENYIDNFKNFKVTFDYIKILIHIIKNLGKNGREINLEISLLINSLKRKKYDFYYKNIENYLIKSKLISKTINYTYLPFISKEKQLGVSEFYKPIKEIYRASKEMNLGINESAILILIYKFQKMSRTQIALELNQNHSSVRYTIRKLLNEKFIDYDISKTTKKDIKKSSNKYFLSEKGLKFIQMLIKES